MMWLSVIDEVLLLFLGTLKHIHVSLSLSIHASKSPRNSNNTSQITTRIMFLTGGERAIAEEKARATSKELDSC